MGSTRVPFASLAALAAAASAYPAESDASAVESAKRDLRALPAAESQAEGAGKPSLFSGSSALPGLSLPNSATSPSPTKTDEAKKPPSGGWLLDGVRGLEAESREREAAERKRAAEPASLRAAGVTADVNPLGSYLDQWLLPRDQGLNLAGANAPGGATSESNAAERAREKDALSSTVSPFQTDLPGLAELAGNKRGTNPYLNDPLQASPERSPFTAAAGDRGIANTPAASSLAPQLTLPFAPPAHISPTPEAKVAPSAPPTVPIVDDRKYFPQLRRF